jgi:hypothetical protein
VVVQTHVPLSLVKSSGHTDAVFIFGISHGYESYTLEGEALAKKFAQRLITRIGVVGLNETTGALIEESWERYLEVFGSLLRHQPFLVGNRPGALGYGCFGEMTMLVLTDPKPQAISRYISAWPLRGQRLWRINLVWRPMNLLGLIWMRHRKRSMSYCVRLSYYLCGSCIANAKAAVRGDKILECELDGEPWVQETFVYQAICLQWLREAYAARSDKDRERGRQCVRGFRGFRVFVS